MMVQQRLSLFIVCVGMLMPIAQAMNPNFYDFGMPNRGPYGDMSYAYSNMLGFKEQEARKALDDARHAYNNAKREHAIDPQELKRIEQDFEEAKKHYENILRPTIAKLVATSMVDPRHAPYMGDVEDSISKAILRGVTVNVADQAGVVMRGKIKGILDKILGGSLDFVTSKAIDIVDFIYKIIFYDGVDQFTLEGLTEWQNFVNKLLVDISITIEKGLAASLRGHDMHMRPQVTTQRFEEDLFGDEMVNNQKPSVVVAKHDPFLVLLHCYVDQLQHIARDMQMRKECYAKNSWAYFYAGQIEVQLNSLASVLSQAQSLAELDSAFGSNKSTLVSIRNNIVNLFDGLKAQVAPKSYSLKDSLMGRNNRMVAGDSLEDFPMSFGGRLSNGG